MNPIPLAEKLRPKNFQDVVGQAHLVGENGWLQKVISSKNPLSILLSGPPGCGKTTLAKLYASAFDASWISINPIFQGVTELKKAIQEFQETPLFKNHLIVFVDEIHRFNKAQQDAFLPFVESGIITLIGATTENPSFAINNALLSRLRVLHLSPLTNQDLSILVRRFLEKNPDISLNSEAFDLLLSWSSGDARFLTNMLETLSLAPKSEIITKEVLSTLVQKKSPLFDKQGDGHYNLISALHKSVRGSDPDAALYWLCRILESGEDRKFIIRRLLRMAVEDIGLADPNALNVTLQASQSFEQLGSPEGELAIAQAVVYLSLCPKSNALYTAYNQAKASAQDTGHLNPPKIILNAPTQLMKNQGYGEGYIYDHDTPNGFSGQNYFPREMEKVSFFKPVDRGFERDLQNRLKYFQKLRENINSTFQ